MLLIIFLLAFIYPIGTTYADSAVIDAFSIKSEIIPGENVSVAVTVSYDFSSETEINPGIFSFVSEDWIVDTILPASGSGTEVYEMEFPVPEEEGIHLYQANVWYIIEDEWFFDGIMATYNFTIQVGDINGTEIEEFANILEFSVPESVEILSNVNVTMKLDYALYNETEFSIKIQDTNDEIQNEEFISLSGSGQTDFSLSFIAPEFPGQYSYTLWVEYESRNTTQEINISVVAPEIPDPETPDDPETPPEDPPPITTTDPDPETPDPEDPPSTGWIPGFDVISSLVGSLALIKYWIKKD